MIHPTTEQVEEWASWVEGYAELHRQLAVGEDEDTAELRESDAQDADSIAEHLRHMDLGKAVKEVQRLDTLIRDTYYEDLEGFSELADQIIEAEGVADRAEAGELEAARRRYQFDLEVINRRRRLSRERALDPEAAGWTAEDVHAEARRIRGTDLEQLKRRLMR